ncbi:hypothetical protein Tco_0763562 [Tanacetum coccineum]
MMMMMLRYSSPYEEDDLPSNLPPPDSDTESEDTAVAPTPDDHESPATRDVADDAATTVPIAHSHPTGSPLSISLAQERATRENTNGAGEPGGNIRGNAQGQGGAPPARECTYSSFIKCNPTSFHDNEGAVELSRWFEKTESVFCISECAKRNKVKFAASTLQGRALTWWNSEVATLGLEKRYKRREVDVELRVEKISNIAAYTQRFNELVLLCPEMVLREKKKVEAYVRGLPENIKGETTSSRHVVLNEAVRMAHTLMEQKLQAKAERIAESNDK